MTLFNEYIDVTNIDNVYWTLVTEIKFYFLIFFLIVFNWLKHYKVWISIWLTSTIAFFIVELPYFMGRFISPYYSPYFIAGATFYLARKNGLGLFHVVVLLTSLILASIHAYNNIDGYAHTVSEIDRFIAIAIVCTFYCFFLLISIKKVSLPYKRSIYILGGLTYPLYLLHNVFGKLIFDNLLGTVPPLLLILFVTIIVLALSYLIHVYLERMIADGLKSYLLKTIGARNKVVHR